MLYDATQNSKEVSETGQSHTRGLGSVQVFHQCVWGRVGGLNQYAETADGLEEVGWV